MFSNYKLFTHPCPRYIKAPYLQFLNCRSSSRAPRLPQRQKCLMLVIHPRWDFKKEIKVEAAVVWFILSDTRCFNILHHEVGFGIERSYLHIMILVGPHWKHWVHTVSCHVFLSSAAQTQWTREVTDVKNCSLLFDYSHRWFVRKLQIHLTGWAVQSRSVNYSFHLRWKSAILPWEMFWNRAGDLWVVESCGC